MFNKPTQQQLALMPKLYSTDSTPMKDKFVYQHFSFPGGSDWWAMEFDGHDTLFGFVVLRNDFQMSEAGLFSLSELSRIKLHGYMEIECDPNWHIRPAHQVERICIARGWPFIRDPYGIDIECPNCKKIIHADSANNDIQCSECKITILQQRINGGGHLTKHTRSL